MKLQQIKVIYLKIWQNLTINLDQEQWKLKIKKRDDESAYAIYEGQILILNAFKRGIFQIKATKDKGLEIITSKQMLQRLPIVLVKVKAGSTS